VRDVVHVVVVSPLDTVQADETDALQYGLIAEEVEKIYPELVVHDASGKIETVAYHLLPAMLLNEVQKLARQLEKRDEQIDALAARLNELERQAQASEPGRLVAASR